MTAPGTRGLFLVAMVGHEVRCGEGLDGGTPLGGVWHVSARSVHAGLPEEKRLGAVVEKRSIALSRANAESLLQCPQTPRFWYIFRAELYFFANSSYFQIIVFSFV